MDRNEKFFAICGFAIIAAAVFAVFGNIVTAGGTSALGLAAGASCHSAPQADYSPAGSIASGSATGSAQQAAGAAGAAATGAEIAKSADGVQEVNLYVQGAEYYPNPITVKKGVPVRIIADVSRVPGCAKSIVIPEFGVRKYVRAGDNEIEFTPDKSGTFPFSCSMGMYQGTIVVQDADGSVASFTGSAPPVQKSSCGANGGGCGCGG